jgi:hypothetical protein
MVAVSVRREVRRQNSTRNRGAFIWRVEGGTAYPGVDYRRMQPQVVSFQEGQTERTLFIPLINTRATLPGHRARSFTVALAPVAGGPTLGRLNRMTVTIDPASGTNPTSTSQLISFQPRTATPNP